MPKDKPTMFINTAHEFNTREIIHPPTIPLNLDVSTYAILTKIVTILRAELKQIKIARDITQGEK